MIVAVNNDDGEANLRLPDCGYASFVGLLSGQRVEANGGCIQVKIQGCGGDIFVPEGEVIVPIVETIAEPVKEQVVVKEPVAEKTEVPTTEPTPTPAPAEEKKTGFEDKSVTEGKSYESMSIEELQEAILSKMAKNGPVTEQMLRTVRENIYHDSLINWVKSFR